MNTKYLKYLLAGAGLMCAIWFFVNSHFARQKIVPPVSGKIVTPPVAKAIVQHVAQNEPDVESLDPQNEPEDRSSPVKINFSRRSEDISAALLKILPVGTSRDEAMDIIKSRIPHEREPTLNSYSGVFIPDGPSGRTGLIKGDTSIHVILGRVMIAPKNERDNPSALRPGTGAAIVTASWAFDNQRKLQGVYVRKSFE